MHECNSKNTSVFELLAKIGNWGIEVKEIKMLFITRRLQSAKNPVSIMSLSLVLVATGLLLSTAQAANFIDIAQEVNGCLLNSTYWFMPLGTVEANRVSCLTESVGETRLVVIEDQLENDCLAKYLIEHFSPTTAVKYATGLSDKQYRGIWEWQNSDEATAYFQHWAPGSLSTTATDDCAFMYAGITESKTGFWDTVSCTATSAGLYAICEKTKVEGVI